MKEGIKYDQEKIKLHLLSIPALLGTGKVLNFGAKKYGERNWEKGWEWSRNFSALLRHLFAFWDGEDLDPESGLSHLDHASCCMMFMQHSFKTKIGTDDRPKTLKYKLTHVPITPNNKEGDFS